MQFSIVIQILEIYDKAVLLFSQIHPSCQHKPSTIARVVNGQHGKTSGTLSIENELSHPKVKRPAHASPEPAEEGSFFDDELGLSRHAGF